MTSEEYLNQARRLDYYIKSTTLDLEAQKELACSVSSVGFEEHSGQRIAKDAKFVEMLHLIENRENELKWQLEKYIKLKEEILNALCKMDNDDERTILKDHYLNNYSWAKLSRELYVDEKTVRRWHQSALEHFEIPKNHIEI